MFCWQNASLGLLGMALSVGGALAASKGPAPAKVDFNREVRPILAENCYACHGPDDQARKAKLRLDRKEEAFKPLKSGDFAIVPADPAKSRLVERITAKDPDDIMPPIRTGKKLAPPQISLLQRWIAEGADWPIHWSFTKPQRPPVPEVKQKRWPHNPIDNFVLARLEKEGLKPSRAAEKTALIRRTSLDLNGLPPTLEEVDAFLADKGPKADDQLVDRLLASPRYGEHMAKSWLDAARYADSHGFHIDAQRDIWAYRDWVVNAFNANKPFDQFTIEQLAGDLLPNPTVEQKVASGYIRCNMSTGEGGAIDAEYQAKYAFDRVETTSTIWLGMTLVCARCHTHKYDPIAQKEYYGLYAFFNNLDEPVMDGNKPNPDPFLRLPSAEQSERLGWLQAHLAEARRKVEAPAEALDQAQQSWSDQWHHRLSSGWAVQSPTEFKSVTTNGARLRKLDDTSLLAEGPNPEKDVYEVSFKPKAGPLAALRLDVLPDERLPRHTSARSEDGRFELSEFEAEVVARGKDGQPGEPKKLKFLRGLADAAEKDREIDKALDANADTAWSVSAEASTAEHTALFLLAESVPIPEDAVVRVRLRFESSKSGRAIGRFRLGAAQGGELASLLHPPKNDPWQVIGPFKTAGLQAGLATVYEPERTIDLKKSYPGVREEIRWSARPEFRDGGSELLVNELHGVHGAYYFYRTLRAAAPTRLELSLRADDLFKLWLNDSLVLERADADKDKGVSRRVTVTLPAGENRFLIKVVNHQGAAHFAFDARVADAEALSAEMAAILSVRDRPSGPWQARVRDYYRRQHSAEFQELFANLEQWREEETALDQAIPTTLVAKEAAKPRATFLLMRGEYDKPGEAVMPAVPNFLPRWPAAAPTNRLGLARWLLDPAHPLTARVAVNRLWQQFFGVGLVKTVEDFGVQGERPSHPELLDWLAVEFMQSGWDVKHIQRLIATSATYRQSSRSTPELYARDPDNRLLARGPRFRADAEVVRDTMLFVSGLLVDKRGGRSVKPYEPPGLWEAVSFNNAQKYVPDRDGSQYRRSLYTSWKRQSPPPNMLIFDAPTREYCVARRPRTNTPLQALTLLNDPQFVEASRALAQRMLLEGGADPARRVAYGFRLATGRSPRGAELKILLEVLDRQLQDYHADKEAAQKLLSVGETKPKEGVDPGELAAWTNIASLLLNLDETVTKG